MVTRSDPYLQTLQTAMMTKPIKRILDNIFCDLLDHYGTSFSVWCNPYQIRNQFGLILPFEDLLGVTDFYLARYNEEYLVLRSDNAEGVINWLFDGHCSSVELAFSTYGNDAEEVFCDTSNFDGVTVLLDDKTNATSYTDSYKFVPFREVYENKAYETAEVVDLLKVFYEARLYLTEAYFNQRKMLCDIAGSWKPLIR